MGFEVVVSGQRVRSEFRHVTPEFQVGWVQCQRQAVEARKRGNFGEQDLATVTVLAAHLSKKNREREKRQTNGK